MNERPFISPIIPAFSSISVGSNNRLLQVNPRYPSYKGLIPVVLPKKQHVDIIQSTKLKVEINDENDGIIGRNGFFDENLSNKLDEKDECDVNYISMNDMNCMPDQIDKSYWQLLSSGVGIEDNSLTDTKDSVAETNKVEVTNNAIDRFMTACPIFSPFFAFFTYPSLIPLFDDAVDIVATVLRTKNWINVDGNAYQAELITPAVNGIIVPAVSILFATLISQTISTLRERQVDIRTSLNKEASEIRILQSLLESFEDSEIKSMLRKDLTEYTMRIISECAPMQSNSCTEVINSEMNNFYSSLNKMSCNPNLRTSEALLSQASGAVVRLNNERSARISAVQTTFPVMHYLVLATLASSICLAFLLETNQKTLIFLAETELRFLWTILIGAFSALAAICYDLLQPFQGNYQIVKSVIQFYNIRDSLVATEKAKRGILDVSMSSSIK